MTGYLAAVPGGGNSPTARAFLLGYVHTLTVLLVGLVGLAVGWSPASATPGAAAHPWPAATAATITWLLGASVWLHHRGWRGARLCTVTWAAPAALVVPLIGLGWVSSAGLPFWAALSAVLAVALDMGRTPLVRPVDGGVARGYIVRLSSLGTRTVGRPETSTSGK
jgi:hypothetical protein